MPLRSNHYGMRARLNLILEFSSSGYAQPRYTIDTAIESPAKRDLTPMLLGWCLGFTVIFARRRGHATPHLLGASTRRPAPPQA